MFSLTTRSNQQNRSHLPVRFIYLISDSKIIERDRKLIMNFLDIRAFVPSGKDYERSKDLFKELGFDMTFDAGDFAGFEKDGCKFFLQNYDSGECVQHFMMAVGISNAAEFRNNLLENKVAEKYGIKIGTVVEQPYGKEVCIVDIAGVLWHFVEPSAEI